MTYRAIQVGTGGMGAAWCRSILPPFVESGDIEVVAAVDILPEMLVHARDGLGLRPEQCFTNLETAFNHRPADICIVVVPPAAHEQVVESAIRHKSHILSEKPISDTMAGCIRIARNVEQAGKKCGITMSHRFDQDKTTFREIVQSGDFGPLDYLVCRFTCDNREFASWGKFRHEMNDPLLIEGAVHHLDILADIAGAPCQRIFARTWNPLWGEYAGDSQALVTMDFKNGVRAIYEGAKSNAAQLNCWGQEYIRAECQNATITLDRKEITILRRSGFGGRSHVAEIVPLLERQSWGHAILVEQFLDWLDGGDPMPTAIGPNLRSTATIFAAIESSKNCQPIDVDDFFEESLAEGAESVA